MNITVEELSRLNKLIILNNSRYQEFKKLEPEIADVELKELFNTTSLQSKQFCDELKCLAPREVEDIGRYWKLNQIFDEIRRALESESKTRILSACELEEELTDKTYKEIIENPEGFRAGTLFIIGKQHIELGKSYSRIKRLLDNLYFHPFSH